MSRMSRRTFVVTASTALLTNGLARRAAAQASYPSQDIHFICAYPPGSGADIIVRWYAEKLRPIVGRTILVENKVGASGNIATETAARAKPDGYTIYVHGVTGLAANMHLMKNPSVDVAKAIQVAATIERHPTMFVVASHQPWKTLQELTDHVRSRGAKATYGISNPNGKVCAALYKEHAKLQAVEVMYRTAPNALNDMASGVIDYGVFDNAFSMAQVQAGRLRVLGVTTPVRMKSTPDLPTMMEQGIPISVTAFFGAMVPATTPRPIVDQINTWFNQLTMTDEARDFLYTIASDPWPTTPDEAQGAMLKEIDAWGGYVKIAKIEAQ